MDKDAVSFYLNSAGRVPLLTAAEEIDLGHKVQRMMRLLEENPSGPYTNPERKALHVGKRAKDRMILANLRLVTLLAKKYNARCKHLEFADLLQEGCIGLIRGVEKFDPQLGYKFSTYAYWWIRQGVARAVSTIDRSIRLPAQAMDVIIKLRYFVPRFEAEHCRKPSLEEMAEECKVTPTVLENYLRHAPGVRSLDERAAGEDGRSCLVDLLPCHRESPWDFVDSELRHEQATLLCSAIKELPSKQREVMQLRLDLGGDGGDGFFPLSQVKVANRLGVSRRSIADTERRALKKLRFLQTLSAA
jgi:RNA polymerase primary sigma factor